MDEVLTGVLSLGEPFMAAKFSQSYCDMGMGPCCLRMSARALEKKKEGKAVNDRLPTPSSSPQPPPAQTKKISGSTSVFCTHK